MTTDSRSADRISSLSNEELSDLMASCQRAIAEGNASIEDYEAFLLCQRELSLRTWG